MYTDSSLQSREQGRTATSFDSWTAPTHTNEIKRLLDSLSAGKEEKRKKDFLFF
jgi:hypothetical protein